MPLSSLKGKRALITGGSRGIGRAIGLKLGELGAKVAVQYYKNEDAAKDTLAKIEDRGAEGFIVQADVMVANDIKRMIGEVKKNFGGLDILVANARPEIPDFYKPPLEINVEQWGTAIHSQATAFLLAVQEVVPLMSNGGRILTITYTPGGRTGSWQPWVAMGAAKAAMDSLMRYFAVALARRGITVNAVSPGVILGPDNPVEGGVLVGLPKDVQQAIKDWHAKGWVPARRTGTPQDVADMVALVCMEESRWLTGNVLFVDGGASLMDTVFPLEIQGAAS